MNRLPNVQNHISQRFVRARVARRKLRNILCFTLLMLMFVKVAVAGNLTGKVTSMSGVTAKPAPVGSVLVSVYQIETKRKTVTRTNNSGAYQFRNLAKGAYLIQVEKDGRQVYQGKVEVPDGDTTFDIKI